MTEQFEKFIAKEGQRLIGWRDVPVTLDGLGKAVLASMPVIRQCFIARGPNCADQDAFERKLLVIRKQTQNPLAQAGRKARHAGPGRALHAELLEPHDRLQGAAARAPGRQLLRRPARSRLRLGARPRPPALLDQHLPQLEAGAPLSLHRPQRRDQHRARQRQLDERAPPDDGIAAARAPISTRCGRSSRTASRTPPASTTRSSCCCSAATRSPMR